MDIEKEIEAIKERNSRVEADKAWETSNFRIITLTMIIYVLAFFLLYVLQVKNYFLSALVPAAGYFLSVQSLPFIKHWWIGKYQDKHHD